MAGSRKTTGAIGYYSAHAGLQLETLNALHQVGTVKYEETMAGLGKSSSWRAVPSAAQITLEVLVPTGRVASEAPGRAEARLP